MATIGKQAKLCVCGRSKKLPICDGSHLSEEWNCADPVTHELVAFCSSTRYANLALKLAAHYSGSVVTPGKHPPAIAHLVLLVDGSDLRIPLDVYRQVEASRTTIISFDVSPNALARLFPENRIVRLPDADMVAAFKLTCEVLDGAHEGTPPTPGPLKSAFISHAVSDEFQLMPAVDYLRDVYAAEIFLCADSIDVGSMWQQSITSALESKDCFILLLSAATLSSHFCSFETGMAYALGKRLILLSLDGSMPPVFVQHLQAIDLPRIVRQKPWLDIQDALLSELLRVLT